MIKMKVKNDVVSKISECFSEIGLRYKEVEIDRVHHIGNLIRMKVRA